jgi:glycosyltransferase involved in cell wall biosynthesis
MLSSRTARPSRVAIISQMPPPVHGSTVMTRTLIECLSAGGVEIQLVDRRFSRNIGEVGQFSLRKVVAAFSLWMRLIRVVFTFRPEAVIVFATTRPLSFLVDCLAATVLRKFRVPYICYVHTVGFRRLARRGYLFNHLVGRLLNRSDGVVCLAPGLLDDVRPWAPSNGLTIIANTLEEPPSSVPEPRLGEPLRIAFLSNLLPEKGAPFFMEVAWRLGDVASRLRFTMAGDGSSELQAEAVAASEELCDAFGSQYFSYVGSLDTAAKWKFLANSDVLVFPSTYQFEAQPLVVLEAMSQSVAVVAFRVGAVEDMVVDRVTGRLCDPLDVNALEQSIRELLVAPDHLLGMKVQARDRFAREFGRETFALRWLELLGRTAGRGE